MPAVKDVIKPIEVNLVEEKEWEPWDPAGKITDWASDNAYESFQATGSQECRSWLEDVIATGGVSIKDWSPKRFVITEEDADRVCWVLMEKGASDDNLEAFFKLIIDALTWMYEAAYTPQDSDLEWALEQAQEKAVDSVELDEGVWEPLGLSDEKILEEVVQAIRYERQENHYDRFLRFYPSQIDSVMKLLGALGEGEGYPDITDDEYLDALRYDLQSVFDDVVAHFWDILEKDMQEVDVFNRTDWEANWTRGILRDKDMVKDAVQGIRKFLIEATAEESNA